MTPYALHSWTFGAVDRKTNVVKDRFVDFAGLDIARMPEYVVRSYRSSEPLARNEELAHRIATMALDDAAIDTDVTDMVINRVIDNAAVAVASLKREPVATARDQALAHTASPGASVFGLPARARVSPEWAAWANGVAVRELDYHDTFLAADYSHPADNIPPLLAVAQHRGTDGASLVRGLAAAYETQIALVRGICLHEHRIDHVAHLGPSAAAGIGALLGLDVETVYQAIGQALHVTTATRQSRKGQISTWKAYAPAFAGKMAIESVDRAMRGQTSPAPIYEGEDGVIARLLSGPEARYTVGLPGRGEPKRAIMDSYTKEHSAEYQAQALIDLAVKLRTEIDDFDAVERVVIHTSHHTHNVIGSGANDPQKYDPQASRETLDHSIPYIFAVALQDGSWHHVDSYARERATRPDTVALWQKVSTVEDPKWTELYRHSDPLQRAFGGRAEIVMRDGRVVSGELAVANTHPAGARPFSREQYVHKFRTLADGVVTETEQDRFLTDVEKLPRLGAGELDALTVDAGIDAVEITKGIF